MRHAKQSGFTIIELVIASAILLVVVAGLLGAVLLVASQNEAQGNVATRTTELGQDKIEQLLALSSNNPALGGTLPASSSVGAVPPAVPVTNYVDYMDQSGNAATASTAIYTRQWSISTDATATLKTITVVVTARTSTRGIPAPSTTVVCYKSNGT
jgi:prepilin-type N-terminal cleavage/methylation domain-containing protein